MGFFNLSQLHETFSCLGFGFLLGGYYDLFRLFRVWGFRSRAAVFVQDVLFCITATPFAFLFCLVTTNGVLRFYVFIGFAIGFFAYRYTVGKWILTLFSRLIRMCRQTARRCLQTLKEVKNSFKKTEKFSKKS